MPNLSISGAVSGIDTASLVNQLMQVEGQQQAAITRRKDASQKTADAYSALTTALTTLAGKATALAKTSDWVGSSATSSATSVVPTAKGRAEGSVTFDVVALAAAHSLISDDAVGSTGAVVASGSISITGTDGQPKSVPVGGGTLTEVVSAINASDTGVRAAAVQTSPGQFRLQLTATTSGAASQFSVTGLTGFSGMSQLTAGTDARITVGSNPLTSYDVTSSTNTFSGLVEDLSFTVSKLETGVTVNASVDGAKVADQVQALVSSINDTLADITKRSSYDPSTRSGGDLYGEGSIRRLQQQILSTIGVQHAAGIQLTRDGKLTFDRQQFLDAYQADPAAVAAAYGASLTHDPTVGVTGRVSLRSLTSSTEAGTYDVTVSVAAAREQWKLSPAGGVVGGQTVVLTRGSVTMSYTAGVGESLADFAAAINSRTSSLGLGIGATVSGSEVLLTAASAGAAAGFTATLGGTAGTRLTTGTDIEGEIDGWLASGVGDVLSVSNENSPVNGLAVQVTATSADIGVANGGMGSITVSKGLAQRITALIDGATDSRTGTLATAKQGRLDEVTALQTQIDAWTTRLEARREALQRQFTAMETAISRLKTQTTALSGLTASLSTNSSEQ